MNFFNIFINRFHRKNPLFFAKLYRSFSHNKFLISHRNILSLGNSLLKHCVFQVGGGSNNQIIVKDSRLNTCCIKIFGSNNLVLIHENCMLDSVELHIEDDDNRIIIGESSQIYGPAHLAAIEGTVIKLGKGALVSRNVYIRTGDSHSILDESTKERINPSQSIEIKEHIWIGHNVIILKGSKIESDTIVAAGAVVTAKDFPSNCIIGGNPARILKEGVNWDANRI